MFQLSNLRNLGKFVLSIIEWHARQARGFDELYAMAQKIETARDATGFPEDALAQVVKIPKADIAQALTAAISWEQQNAEAYANDTCAAQIRAAEALCASTIAAAGNTAATRTNLVDNLF